MRSATNSAPAGRTVALIKEAVTIGILAFSGYVIYKLYDSMVEEPRRINKLKSVELANKLGKESSKIGDLNEHEMMIAGDVICNRDIDVSFADIGGMTSELQEVQDNVILPMLHWKDMHSITNISTCPPGVLLYGKPGTGKTMTAKAIAKESGATFIAIKASTVLSKWVGESEKLMTAMFSLARKLAPTVIFIDEIDTLLKTRNNSDTNKYNASALGLLMSEWDGMMTPSPVDKKPPIVILGATNRPGDIDPAFLRRMPFRVMTTPPDRKGRLDILNLQFKSMLFADGFSMDEVADRTDGFTGAEIKELCRLVSLVRLKEAVKSKSKTEGAPGDRSSSGPAASYLLSNQDFVTAINRVKPSTANAAP